MNTRAYLVGILDKESGVLLGFDVFSEETPTLPLKVFCFTVLEARGDDFAGALRDLAEHMREPFNTWMLRHLSPRAREIMGWA